MSPSRMAWAAVAAACLAGTTRAADADPLRLVPAEADLVIKVENPRKLVEAVTALDAVKRLDQFEPVRELLASTAARRLFQLVTYYERELGYPWAEGLDRVAGNGIVVAVRAGKYEQVGGDFPAVLIIRGKDPAAVQKFFGLAVAVLEQDMSTGDVAAKFERKTHRGADAVKVADGVLLAQAGDAIVLANKDVAMERVLELREKGGKSIADNPALVAAKKLQGGDPLAWLWYNFEPVKQLPQAKDLFAQPRNDPVQTILFSGLYDVLKRSKFVSAGLHAEGGGFRLAVRLPAGSDGRAEETGIHVPPDGQSGSLPLLEPEGVIFSHSFYFDFGALWDRRDKVFNAEVAKGFGELDAQASKFLPGTSVPKLFRGWGPYHRFVVASHRKTDYAVEPKQKIPGFAFVSSMRDPDFGRSMEVFIRGGVLLAAGQFKLKLTQSEYKGVKIVAYKFPEDVPLEDDVENVRFNLTPCFARTKDQFIACSTVELCRALIDEVGKQGEPPVSSSNMRMRFYAAGNADLLNVTPEQLKAQFILGQAIPVGDAEKQVKQFVEYLKGLGWVGIRYDYGKDAFEVAFEWKQK